jgi:hypothetical protein
VTARWLVRLYPAAWRERYGAELEDLIDRQPASLRVMLDVLLGALDAHVHPELGPTAATPDGVLWIFACRPTRSMWLATAALVAIVCLAWLRRTFGFNFLLDLLYFGIIGALPIAISTVGWRRDPRRLIILMGGVAATGLIGSLLTNVCRSANVWPSSARHRGIRPASHANIHPNG